MRILLLSAALLGTAACVSPQPSAGDLFAPWSAPPSGRMTLSNFIFERVHVQAFVTAGPGCTPPAGEPVSDFSLPLNGTQAFETPPGSDICWRRELARSERRKSVFGMLGWTAWNHAYLASGRRVDVQL